MKNAFLVSDDDLKSLRSGEPWSIELNGPAVFLHESVLKLLMQQQSRSNLVPNVNGAYDTKGRPLTCDQPDCYRNLAENKFINYAARQMHRATTHGIPGEYSEKHKRYPRRQLPAPQGKLPAPALMATTSTQVAINRLKPASYQYGEFDALGVCGIGKCDYKEKKVRALHFHRSVKHGVRGINWNRKSHIKARGKRKVGRPKKVAV